MHKSLVIYKCPNLLREVEEVNGSCPKIGATPSSLYADPTAVASSLNDALVVAPLVSEIRRSFFL